jgi:hypothetical protein
MWALRKIAEEKKPCFIWGRKEALRRLRKEWRPCLGWGIERKPCLSWEMKETLRQVGKNGSFFMSEGKKETLL